MDTNNDRRNFLKTFGKVAAGAALLSVTAPIQGVLAESAEEEKIPFKWVPNALPCELIKEITDDKTPEGYRSFEYTPDNRAHITLITFDVKLEDNTVHNIKFTGGCDGSTMGVARVANGKGVEFIVSRLKGLECNLIKSGSSCPDQLANAVEQADRLITGNACTYCFFAGNFRNMKCANA